MSVRQYNLCVSVSVRQYNLCVSVSVCQYSLCVRVYVRQYSLCVCSLVPLSRFSVSYRRAPLCRLYLIMLNIFILLSGL